MLYAEEFRRIARDSLRGKWSVAVGTGFVASLLGASIIGIQGGAITSRLDNDSTREYLYRWLQTDLGCVLKPWVIGVLILIGIWLIVIIVIGGAVTLGYARFNLNIIDRKDAQLSDIFYQIDRIGAGFCMQFLRRLFTVLWMLLLIIPGIIAFYSYAMTPYIMTEHPEYGANEAIGYSKELMRGNRWRLFCMQFSFIGWMLLSLLTLGIGFLWLVPYVESANAAFYREISKPCT